MATVATVVLDDTDITEFVTSGSVTRRLNRISTATITVQMKKLTELFGTVPSVGSYLKVYFANDTLGSDGTLWHHGRCMLREVTADKDSGSAVFNSSDPLELWTHRPVRDDDGDFSKPGIIDTYLYAPQIVQAMINNSEDTTAGGGGPPPADAEGPLRIELGHVDSGITEVRGVPTDWPMTMAELTQLLISTGTLDVVCSPIEFDVNDNYGEVALYNGDFGTDRTGDVILSYGMGFFNVRSLRWNVDMTNLCNKLWYYLGPRVKTARDPAGDQHWQANVQGDDPGLAYPPGGALSPPASPTNNQVGVQDGTSRDTYDVRMDIQIFDALGDEALDGREMFRRQWQQEQWLRAQPRTIVHVTPQRNVDVGLFDIGDLITVQAHPDVAGGFDGAQRVYEYTVSWDAEDSVAALGEIQVSSDQEGFDA